MYRGLGLGALAGVLRRRARFPDRLAFASALAITFGGIALLLWVLVPPLIAQTQELVKVLPAYIGGWEATIEEVAMLVAGRAPVDLCGISLGALLALRIAADRPSFTRRLVLCAGFAELPAGVRRRVSVIAGLARFVPKRLLHRQLVAGIPEPHRSIPGRRKPC